MLPMFVVEKCPSLEESLIFYFKLREKTFSVLGKLILLIFILTSFIRD